MSVFGSGEADTHALSVAFAIFTVPAAWLGGRALFGDRAAWIAALLAAINPFLHVLLAGDEDVRPRRPAVDDRDGDLRRHLRPGQRAWLPVFSVSLALIAYAHNWGLFLAVGTVAALVPIYRQAAPPSRLARPLRTAWKVGALRPRRAGVLGLGDRGSAATAGRAPR